MQPYSDEFSQRKLTPQKTEFPIGKYKYRALVGKGQGWVQESNPEGLKTYRIEHVFGRQECLLLPDAHRARSIADTTNGL